MRHSANRLKHRLRHGVKGKKKRGISATIEANEKNTHSISNYFQLWQFQI